MQKSLLTSAFIAVLASTAMAQTATGCDLYYKFDRRVGNKAVNYGTAVVDSTIMTMGATRWQAGKYGGALGGSQNTSSTNYNWCDTGWTDAVSTGFTVSWWCKQRVSPGTGLSYIFSGKGSFRCFTNGVASTQLWMRAWGGIDIKLPSSGASFQARAASTAGVNVAVVVNKATNKAQWYVNGAPHGAAITISAAVNIAAGSFRIGKHTSNTSSFAYDIDEFRFCKRAATAAQIRAWHAAPAPAWGTLGKDCGLKHRGVGVPKSGNPLYALEISGPTAGFRWLFVAGLRPNAGFDMGIAFPALKGCTWYADFLIQIAGASRGGTARIPVPIPSTVSGVGIETQVLGFDGSNKALQSNAVSTKVEK